MPHSQPWQQSGFSELQQQVMLERMQEMQRQQQFQSFTDTRQHSGILNNIDGVQFSPVINGTPVHNNPNMFTTWGQHSGSPSVHGMSQYGGDGIQQYNAPTYDSPMPNAGSNLNQFYRQGISSGSPVQQQPISHFLGFTNSFSGGKDLDSSNQGFISGNDQAGTNMYGQVHQKLSESNKYGSFEHATVLPKNTMAYEINEREQNGWPSNQLENNSMHISPSQGSTTLDPLEEKLLFSMDDNLWDISSGKVTEAGTGNSGNALGSWSALMQSALAETSSSDTGLQEEWSGLTFQNTDPSADYQTSNFVESGPQQAQFRENSMQPASGLSVTEYQYLNSSGIKFPGFHQAVSNNQSEQDRSLHSSLEHSQLFSQPGGRFESNHNQSSQTVGKPQSQSMSQSKQGWASPSYGRAVCSPRQLDLAAAGLQTNNADIWSAQKTHSGAGSTLFHNSVGTNTFPNGLDSRTAMVGPESENQENSQFAYAYQNRTNTPDALRHGVQMVNQHVLNNEGSSMHSNSNDANLSSRGLPETKLSNAVDNSMIFHASNMDRQRSQNVLQLLQNINPPRAQATLVHGSPVSQGQKPTASEAQYHNQTPSQSSSLLPSTSQRFPNHNAMHASQNSWQKSGSPIISSSVPNQSQLHWQQMSRSAVGSQPIQSALYAAATKYANAVASQHQNSPRSLTHANPFAQQYTNLGAHSTFQSSMPSSLSQQDGYQSKPINQWTDVPVQKNSAGGKSELAQSSGFSGKHVEEVIGYPHSVNELETENLAPSGASAKPDISYDEGKTQPHTLSEVQPESVFQPTAEMQISMKNQGGHLDKYSSMNQINILYGYQGDDVRSTMAVTRQNKRKSQTSELLPWHKEVIQGSMTFLDTRTGERDWAQATNQLLEVANEAELLKFGQAVFWPRKRLNLTTRLMQTLLQPAPRSIISKDAASAYESAAYIVARLSLGDACNMSSKHSKTDIATEENSNLGKVLESFSKRIKQLEDVLQRSDGVPSVVDLSVECQDLERFSVINRFAKFHSRAQPNPSEPFSSGPPKIYPQRYVSAYPMPEDIPDELPCISL